MILHQGQRSEDVVYLESSGRTSSDNVLKTTLVGGSASVCFFTTTGNFLPTESVSKRHGGKVAGQAIQGIVGSNTGLDLI